MKTTSKALTAFLSVLCLSGLHMTTADPVRAQTLDWPSGGTFTVGDVNWAFDVYGLAAGWDDADEYYDDGYAYYPNEFSFSHDPNTGNGGDYFLCGDPTTYSDDAVVTQLDSGSIRIQCSDVVVPGYATLTAQLEFLLYPESSSGYLVRQNVSITNASESYVVIPDLQIHNFPNLHVDYSQGQYAGHEEAEWFIDSINDPFVGWLWEDATFYSQGMGDGRAVALSQAWAKTGTAPTWHFFTDNSYNQGNPYGGSGTKLRTNAPNYFAPQATTHYLTFTNMVLPSVESEAAGAIAKATAIAQTTEYSSFSGRLIEGLPECTTYAGWGTTPGTCEFATNQPISGSQPTQTCSATLAKTGFDPTLLALTGVLAVCAGATLYLLRRNRVKKLHSLMVSPQI